MPPAGHWTRAIENQQQRVPKASLRKVGVFCQVEENFINHLFLYKLKISITIHISCIVYLNQEDKVFNFL